MNAKAPARVLFLLQRPEAWNNISGAWQQMRSDPGFEPTVLALPYNFSSPDPGQRTARATAAFLEEEDVPHVVWTPDFGELEAGRYAVAVFTAPYDRERPNELHFDRVATTVAATVYIPYGLAMGAGTKNRWYQYAQPVQCRSTAVVARSGAEKALYGKYCPTGNGHVHVLGLPRLDLMHALDDFEADPALRRDIGDRIAVLWNSHFSFSPKFANGMEYSTFDRIGAGLLRFACGHPRLALIWRPHPGLFPEMLASGTCTETELQALRSELAGAGIIIDERPDHRHAFALSRALLSDLGSFLIEYLVTGRPILYLRNPDGEAPNEEAAALIMSYYVAEDSAEVAAFLELVLRGEDPLAGERRRASRIALPLLDGQASERVCRLVSELAGRAPHDEPEAYPALALLQARLDAISAEKRSKGPLRRRLARASNLARARLVEWVKAFPALLRLLSRRN